MERKIKILSPGGGYFRERFGNSFNPAKVNELKELMAKNIEQGRSTPGKKQDNEGMDNWPEIDWIENSN